MISDLKKLVEVMLPPVHPIDATGNWEDAEQRIGTSLPDDYKEFIEMYGTGSVGRMPIWVFNAHTSFLKTRNDVVAESYQTIFSESPELLLYALFPKDRGLLHWGCSGNGDYLHWLTEGMPNSWKVVIHVFSRDAFISTDVTLVPFLLNLVTQQYDFFPKNLFEPPVVFTPSDRSCVWP